MFPKLDELAGLVGMPPRDAAAAPRAARCSRIAQRAALAYLVIAAVDYVYQR